MLRLTPCLVVALALSACVETVPTCSEPGHVRDPRGACRPESEVPQLDGGRDAGDGAAQPDAPPPDASVCAACEPDRCVDGGCVPCSRDEHCDEGYCFENQCVQCRTDMHADCPDLSRSQCLDNQCVPCGSVLHCPTTQQQCDTSREPATCVECLTSDHCGGDGSRTCDLLTNTCVPIGRATVATCRPCTNDDQCADSPWQSRCVPMDHVEGLHGYYCLPQIDPGRACPRPYTAGGAVPRTSINAHGPTTYCAINEALTTCEAVLDLIGEETCDVSADPPTCRLGGLCRSLPGLGGRCTYRCGASSQCLDATTRPVEATCGTGGGSGPSYCGG